jgi:hypothetical protein
VLVAANDEAITLRDADGNEMTIAYRQIEKTKTVFSWGAAPKPGSRK